MSSDTGLACYLLDVESPKQLSRDKMRGNIFENLVVMEAVKHRMNAGREGGVFFIGIPMSYPADH